MKSVLVAALCLLAACGPNEAVRTRDRTEVEKVLAKDIAVAGLSREADAALGRGEPKEAAKLLQTKAIPAAEDNARAAHGLRPTTPWGKAKSADLASLTADRRASLSTYAKALEGDDGNALLASVEAQRLIERRALALWQAVAAGENGP